MIRSWGRAFVVSALGTASAASTQQVSASNPSRDPVIDVHVHVGSVSSLPRKMAELDSNNVVLALASGPAGWASKWAAAQPTRFMAGIIFPCVDGRVPNNGPDCLLDNKEFPSVAYLRKEFKAGRLHLLGEITTQYAGLSPADPKMEPYYALAEELDLPIAVHLALAPPSTPYKCCPKYRSSFGNPLQLEEVLVRHPKLRGWVMHAGYPYAAEMKALMLVYPQLYVDIAAINLPFIVPRAAFHDFLQDLMRAGLGKRIMFGSDYSPVRLALEAIDTAQFLSADEKRDILYNNAARFLKIDSTAATRRVPPSEELY